MKNYTLCILKPDVLRRGLEECVVELIRKENFYLSNRLEVNLSPKDVAVIYLESRHQPHYDNLVQYLTSGNSVCYVIKGDNALNRFNALVGATDPAHAGKDTIRGKIGESILINSVHSSNENRVIDEIVHIYGVNNAREIIDLMN